MWLLWRTTTRRSLWCDVQVIEPAGTWNDEQTKRSRPRSDQGIHRPRRRRRAGKVRLSRPPVAGRSSMHDAIGCPALSTRPVMAIDGAINGTRRGWSLPLPWIKLQSTPKPDTLSRASTCLRGAAIAMDGVPYHTERHFALHCRVAVAGNLFPAVHDWIRVFVN